MLHLAYLLLGFIHVVTCLLFITEWYSIIWKYCNLFIHWETDICVISSLATTTKSAANILIQVFEWTCFHLSWVNTKEWDFWVIC